MKKERVAFFKLVFGLFLVLTPLTKGVMAGNTTDVVVDSKNALSYAAMAEAKYERLMRTYVNKMKLAFIEPQDAKTLEILETFASTFSTQSDELKNNLRLSAIHLSKTELAGLNKRIEEKSHSEELFAIHFNEVVYSRMESNPNIKKVVEALQSKSKELLTADFLAVK